MELTNKIAALTVGDVYEQTLAVFEAEKPPTPPRIPGYDNRNGLKNRWITTKQNESPKCTGRACQHKPHGLQRQDVRVDLPKQTGRHNVGTATSSGLQHDPFYARSVRGIPEIQQESGSNTYLAGVEQAKGGSQRVREKPKKRWIYDANGHEWVHCQET